MTKAKTKRSLDSKLSKATSKNEFIVNDIVSNELDLPVGTRIKLAGLPTSAARVPSDQELQARSLLGTAIEALRDTEGMDKSAMRESIDVALRALRKVFDFQNVELTDAEIHAASLEVWKDPDPFEREQDLKFARAVIALDRSARASAPRYTPGLDFDCVIAPERIAAATVRSSP